MVKRIKLKIFCLMLVISLTGCYRENRVYKVDLIVKGTTTEFWQNVYDGAKAAAMIYEIELTYLGPEEEKDYVEQVGILEQSIKRDPNAIILAAAEYNLMATPMEQAIEAGIPVIMVDSAINSTKWISFVSTNNREAGERLAEELIYRTKNTGTVGVISFVQAAYPSADREEGFLSVIEGKEGFTILDTVYCNSNFLTAEQLAEDMIAEHPDLVAIAGLNAQSATGAARALEKLNRKDIVLAGIDCTVEEAAFMEHDILDVAILQNPYLMGYYSVKATAMYLTGKSIEKNIWIDTRVINRVNMFTEENQQLIFPFE